MTARILIAAFVVAAMPKPTLAAPCVPGTLVDYIALRERGCTVNNVTFANFQFLSTVPIALPRQIEIRPAPSLPSSGSLRFAAPWKVPAGRILATNILRYTVMLRANPPAAGRLSLSLGPDRVPGLSGSVRVTEVLPFTYLTVFHQRTDGVSRRVPHAQRLFSPPNVLRMVETRIQLAGGDAGAELSSFTATYGTVTGP